MNVRPDQLHKALKPPLLPVYMVCGEEPLALMEAGDAIRAFLRQQDFTEREVLEVDARFDWRRFSEETAALSLFARRRIIELRLPGGKPGREGGQALRQYCQQPAPDIAVLINAGKVDGNGRKSAWFKAIEQQGMVVQCWPPRLEDLPAWIAQRFRRAGMQADDEAAAFLAEHVEGNLLAAAQEIDKLALRLGQNQHQGQHQNPGRVSLQDVVEAVIDQSRYSVFDLIDNMLEGQPARVVKIIAGLRAEGQEPIMINAMIARELRLLHKLAASAGPVTPQAMQRLGIWKSRQPAFRACLQRHRAPVFASALRRCARIDRASKGQADDDPWQGLLQVCYRLACMSRQ